MKHCRTPYIIYLAVMLALIAASRLALIRSYLGVIAAVLFLYIPIIFLFIKKQQPAFYGISKKSLLKSIARALLAAIIIFPVYIAGFYIYMKHVYSLDVVFSITRVIHQPQALVFAFNSLFMVAVPEEVFYRGYLQSELRQCDRQRVSIFGIKTGASFLIVNALFAAGHLIIIPDIARLAVFFPGLVFSWLREKDDNIAGSVVFHWLSDILSFVLFAMLR